MSYKRKYGSAKAESAEDTEEKNFYRKLLLAMEEKEKILLEKENAKEVLLLEKENDLRKEKLLRLERLGACVRLRGWPAGDVVLRHHPGVRRGICFLGSLA
ncbi:hypothetical protein Vretimale_7137 [Volvox reticuliferus]|uniref:Uncharacterized protein n=1 Tax=Volvox reticuliferus TaxID=1737510 RepID=A0A8J4G8U5_9CHLO|nr:hypothetical protein Vretifemale_11116 [Volvox reticuliferus]GIM02292.1 hypothetical protein Vretimale_7137 [Volvox reticuliferus]